LILAPVAFGGLLLLLTVGTLFWPGLLTGPSRYALELGARTYFANLPAGPGLAMALLFLQGPWLIAVFAAVRAASVAQSMVAGETARGGLEILLASPHRLSEIFIGMLVSSLVLTLLGWISMTLTVLVPSAATLLVLHVRSHLPASYFVAMFFLPIPMVLWANLIALLLVLRFPRLAQVRAGTSVNLVQLIASSPALAFFAAISLRPQSDAIRFGLMATLLGIAGGAAAAAILKSQFRAERFLES
jgi:hypothetical protein